MMKPAAFDGLFAMVKLFNHRQRSKLFDTWEEAVNFVKENRDKAAYWEFTWCKNINMCDVIPFMEIIMPEDKDQIIVTIESINKYIPEKHREEALNKLKELKDLKLEGEWHAICDNKMCGSSMCMCPLNAWYIRDKIDIKGFKDIKVK